MGERREEALTRDAPTRLGFARLASIPHHGLYRFPAGSIPFVAIRKAVSHGVSRGAGRADTDVGLEHPFTRFFARAFPAMAARRAQEEGLAFTEEYAECEQGFEGQA